MKYIRKILSTLMLCLLFITSICSISFAESNLPEVGDFGNWMIEENMTQYNDSIRNDVDNFQQRFNQNIKQSTFVPIEIRLGLMFMKALDPISQAIRSNLVSFTTVFLFIMYAFWIGLNAYKTIRESTDYKQVFYEIFTKGFVIVIWVIILNYPTDELFAKIFGPILSIGTSISNFILDSVVGNIIQNQESNNLSNTCIAIHNYVNANMMPTGSPDEVKPILSPDMMANIMCLPGRLSTFFYHAMGEAFVWITNGLKIGTPITSTIVGIVALVIFIKCIFKYAFMTLGIIVDLFFTIMMLPFTALAESMPSINEKNYAGQIFSGLLKVFNTKKLSDVLATFINTAIYFVSLSIVIAICAILLKLLTNFGGSDGFSLDSSLAVLVTGCLVLHIADKAEDLATQLGGKIDNAFGKQLESDTKNMWSGLKSFGSKTIKAWSKGKLFK